MYSKESNSRNNTDDRPVTQFEEYSFIAGVQGRIALALMKSYKALESVITFQMRLLVALSVPSRLVLYSQVMNHRG